MLCCCCWYFSVNSFIFTEFYVCKQTSIFLVNRLYLSVWRRFKTNFSVKLTELYGAEEQQVELHRCIVGNVVLWELSRFLTVPSFCMEAAVNKQTNKQTSWVRLLILSLHHLHLHYTLHSSFSSFKQPVLLQGHTGNSSLPCSRWPPHPPDRFCRSRFTLLILASTGCCCHGDKSAVPAAWRLRCHGNPGIHPHRCRDLLLFLFVKKDPDSEEFLHPCCDPDDDEEKRRMKRMNGMWELTGPQAGGASMWPPSVLQLM